MSAAGAFTLIANDGKADRMIMATALLNQRIKDVMCAREKAGQADITPTLVDLERTHILFVNAHFKPFAAIGYEYNKVKPQSGNPSLGGGVVFSIPQFGDFFYDMVARVRLSACQAAAQYTPLQTTGTPTSPAVFPFNGTTAIGEGDGTLFYNIVDASGQRIVLGSDDEAAPPVQYRNFVRYCEYPGNRLFHWVKFDVNGNPLDQYSEMIPVMLEKFCTPPNKRVGHDRLVGQEVPLTGYGNFTAAPVSDPNNGLTPQGITKVAQNQSNYTVGLFNEAIGQPLGGPLINGISSTLTNTAPLDATVAPVGCGVQQYDVSRQVKYFVNGPQTPQPIQPPLEIWNALNFWFNKDVRLSIPSVSIPFGQRFISIDLARQEQLVFEAPSIFLETIVDPAPLAAGGPGSLRSITYTPIFQPSSISQVSIEKMEMYINNIFVNPEIHDVFIKRIGFSLIRVYRQQNSNTNQEQSDEKLLSQLKWPIEYMFVGLRPQWNTNFNNPDQWREWHRLTYFVNADADMPMRAETPAAGAIAAMGSAIGSVVPDHYWLPVSTVNSMSLTSHGVRIYEEYMDIFFNAYTPFNYGGPALVTPDDTGALFVNLSLYPRSYQPSGHLNISRARETYLQWTTSYVSANSAAEMFVVAVAINFLLITDGSAVLRYST